MHKWIQPIKSSWTLCQNYCHTCVSELEHLEKILKRKKCFGMFRTNVCDAYLCGRMVNTVGCTVCTFLMTISFTIFRLATLAQHLHSLCYTTNALPTWTELLCYTHAVCTYSQGLLHTCLWTTTRNTWNWQSHNKRNVWTHPPHWAYQQVQIQVDHH